MMRDLGLLCWSHWLFLLTWQSTWGMANCKKRKFSNISCRDSLTPTSEWGCLWRAHAASIQGRRVEEMQAHLAELAFKKKGQVVTFFSQLTVMVIDPVPWYLTHSFQTWSHLHRISQVSQKHIHLSLNRVLWQNHWHHISMSLQWTSRP